MLNEQTIEEFSGIVLIINGQANGRAYTLHQGKLIECRVKFHDLTEGRCTAEFSPPIVAETVQVPAGEMAALALIKAALETAETSVL